MRSWCRALSKMWASHFNRSVILFRSKVISTTGLMTAILHSRCRSMSGNVDNATRKSAMVENVVVPFEISFAVAIHARLSCRNADVQIFLGLYPSYWICGMCQNNMDWIHHLVNPYSWKIAKMHPINPITSEMAAKIVAWDSLTTLYHTRVIIYFAASP